MSLIKIVRTALLSLLALCALDCGILQAQSNDFLSTRIAYRYDSDGNCIGRTTVESLAPTAPKLRGGVAGAGETTGSEEKSGAQIGLWQVYPVPAHDRLSIANAAPKAPLDGIEVAIHAADGRLVQKASFSSGGGEPFTIDISGLPTGVYILHLQILYADRSRDRQSFRVIKE